MSRPLKWLEDRMEAWWNKQSDYYKLEIFRANHMDSDDWWKELDWEMKSKIYKVNKDTQGYK